MRPAPLSTSTLLLVLCALSAAHVSACDGCSGAKAAADAAPAPTTTADATIVNDTPIPTASVAAMVNPQQLPAYAGPTGSIEGIITVTGLPAAETPAQYRKCPEAAAIYGHAFREGALAPGDVPDAGADARWLADAVVAVTGYKNFFIPEKDEAEELTIEGCGFAKRTVTLTFGQRLEVKNLSKDFWTPQLQPASTSVMLMATPNGDPVKLYPKRPGRFLLVDHDRRYAAVDVFVLAHPLHTTSGVGGRYRIDGVPVGKVTVNTSHPRVPHAEASVEIDVKPAVVHRVDLNLAHVPKDAGPPGPIPGPHTRVH